MIGEFRWGSYDSVPKSTRVAHVTACCPVSNANTVSDSNPTRQSKPNLINRLQVPLEEFKSNMTSLVGHFKNECESDVLLLTPSTCNPVSFLAYLRGRGIMVDDTGKTNETSRQYADAVLQVGKETGSPAIDLYGLLQRHQRDGVRDEELFTDGLHYTPRAYKVG